MTTIKEQYHGSMTIDEFVIRVQTINRLIRSMPSPLPQEAFYESPYLDQELSLLITQSCLRKWRDNMSLGNVDVAGDLYKTTCYFQTCERIEEQNACDGNKSGSI